MDIVMINDKPCVHLYANKYMCLKYQLFKRDSGLGPQNIADRQYYEIFILEEQ